MHRMSKYLGSLLLGIGLIAPVGIQAATIFATTAIKMLESGTKEPEAVLRPRLQGLPSMGSPRRRQVPALGGGKARVYRPFYRLDRAQQRAYWRYRHEHPDRDDRR